jgi:flagellar assembly factor FliW
MASTSTNLQRCQTRYFGSLEYDEASVLVFPDGIPAFEREQRFLAIRQPLNEPLVFLQSLSDPDLCFVTLPVQTVLSGFRLSIAPEDLEALGLPTGTPSAIGRDVLCLVMISIEQNNPPTANLLAPVVVNLRTQCGRQVIQTDSKYSHREILPLREAQCS